MKVGDTAFFFLYGRIVTGTLKIIGTKWYHVDVRGTTYKVKQVYASREDARGWN